MHTLHTSSPRLISFLFPYLLYNISYNKGLDIGISSEGESFFCCFGMRGGRREIGMRGSAQNVATVTLVGAGVVAIPTRIES